MGASPQFCFPVRERFLFIFDILLGNHEPVSVLAVASISKMLVSIYSTFDSSRKVTFLEYQSLP